jgi:hypothetical protein
MFKIKAICKYQCFCKCDDDFEKEWEKVNHLLDELNDSLNIENLATDAKRSGNYITDENKVIEVTEAKIRDDSNI